MRVYLDHNATTPLREEARTAMLAAMDVVGNPSSVHAEGRAAKSLIERARAQIAALIDAGDADVIFVSGASEAATLALAPYADLPIELRGYRESDPDTAEPSVMSLSGVSQTVIASAVEHDCVGAWAGKWKTLRPGMTGQINWSQVADLPLASDARVVVAVQAANSETGVLQRVEKFAGALDGAQPRPLLLTDAVQVAGKMSWSFEASRADMALLSAHKLGGPKGIGALVIRRGIDIPAAIKGGGQEMGRRSGTENTIGIAGFGAAAAAATQDMAAGRWEEVAKLRNILETALEAGENKTIFVGKESHRLPNTSCIIAEGWKGETQVMQMDLAGFAISAGSACSSGKVRASSVLQAMGFSNAQASSAIRVSLGLETTQDEVLRFADAWLAKRNKHEQRAA